MKLPRPLHALKNILVLPGSALAWVLVADSQSTIEAGATLLRIILVLAVCCLVAGWNYVLNDFCDRDFDRWHPEKCSRLEDGTASLSELLMPAFFMLGATVLVVVLGGLPLPLVLTLALFVVSGCVYNIAPVRLKRIPFVDVAAEAFNFPVRLMLGWYAVWADGPLPPLSAMLAIWAFGGMLLTGKRAAELARIGDAETARAYRPALLHYTRERAMVICSVYGMVMLFGAGVLFAVYRPLHNLIFLLPAVLFMAGLYLWVLADAGLAARELEPEKLLRRKSVWCVGLLLGVLAVCLVCLPVDLTAWFGLFRGLRG